MIIYYHGSTDKLPVAEHTIFICPAIDSKHEFRTDKDGNKTRIDPPTEWMEEIDGQMKPKQMQVVFHFGQAEVEDSIGKYMLARGLAQKTRLVIRNNWDG